VRSTHNGNTEAGTYESAHLGVRALGLVGKVASKCLDDTLGLLAKEAINRDNKRGEVPMLCQARLKVPLLFARPVVRREQRSGHREQTGLYRP